MRNCTPPANDKYNIPHVLVVDVDAYKLFKSALPSNTRRCANVVLMLCRRRRWSSNIKTTLVQRLVFAGDILFLGTALR